MVTVKTKTLLLYGHTYFSKNVLLMLNIPDTPITNKASNQWIIIYFRDTKEFINVFKFVRREEQLWLF